ncbi:MAG: aminotransferase class I/II-fold pyridoxal phosphate-dependent enzyme, partial [Nitrososphaera sp.]
MMSVSVQGPTAIVDGKKVIHLCSNDYLGLAQNQRVIGKASGALKEVSQCSSRLIAGNSPWITELEAQLAVHRKTEAALVFPTGYMANLGAITALAGKNSTILSDEFNHASIIDACKLSGAAVKIFKHNDTEHLEGLIRKASRRRIIVTEGIFSMDGDISSLKQICKVAQEHDAITVVDDAHGDFIFGRGFSGVPSLLNTKVDIHVSSLSKGLGCFGGYAAASAKVVELLINTSKQFIYTSALPDHLCVAAGEAMKLAKRGNLQARLNVNIAFLRKKLVEAGFAIGNSSSQIIPIMIG